MFSPFATARNGQEFANTVNAFNAGLRRAPCHTPGKLELGAWFGGLARSLTAEREAREAASAEA